MLDTTHRIRCLAAYLRHEARRNEAHARRDIPAFSRADRLMFCAWALYLSAGGEAHKVAPEWETRAAWVLV